MKQTTLTGGEEKEKVEYRVYKAARILNTYEHADYWFWNKYSAHPYVGCEHACEYCYARADKYVHTDIPDDFSRIIKVKRNAAALLKKELKKVKKDVIVTADYQPAEKRFGLSRKMLQIVLDYGFPVHIVEKSDLVVKDLDLLRKINEKTWVCVSFSFSTLDEDISRIVEPIAPSPERRLDAMKKIADAQILTGANLMPVLPFITDSTKMMEDVVKEVKRCGGTFVLAGGLTLDNNVKERYFTLLQNEFCELVPQYEKLYADEPRWHFGEIGKKVGDICRNYGLKDRIPRYCMRFNQLVAEKMFERVYRIELDDPKKAWAYRRAAWLVDELDEDIREIEDVRTLPGIGEKTGILIDEIVEEYA